MIQMLATIQFSVCQTAFLSPESAVALRCRETIHAAVTIDVRGRVEQEKLANAKAENI